MSVAFSEKSLAATLEELQRICDSLARHHQPAARELAAIVWRLYCSLSQLSKHRRKVRWLLNYLITPQASSPPPPSGLG
ncbi:hypothetical protein ACLK2I_09125 [Escherichia coli]